MQKFYLGLDGGGTKTHAIIVNEHDAIIGQWKSGPASYVAVGWDKAIEHIYEALVTAKLKAIHALHNQEIQITAVCFGIASLDTDKDKQLYTDAINRMCYRLAIPQPILVNDAQIALRSGSDNPNAISLICGTGSSCYGINSLGTEVWVGELDYLLSDESSGYMMGAKALRVATKSYDNRGKKTLLEQLICESLNIPTMREAKNKVYEKDFGKTEIAALSLLVFKAAAQHDTVATSIIHETVDEAYLMVHTAAQKLQFNSQFDLVLCGGLFDEPIYKKLFLDLIKKKIPLAEAIFPDKPPVWGAIKLAKTVS